MLSEEWIKEAESNVKIYIRDGLLRKNESDEKVINTFKNNSDESIQVAKMIFRENISSLWVIVSSYYSLYYMANAVLLKLGYKVSDQISHKITSDSLVVYVRDKLEKKLLEDYEAAKVEAMELNNLTDELIKSFEFERKKRSSFQYGMNTVVKRSKANTSLDRAIKFNFELEKLLNGP